MQKILGSMRAGVVLLALAGSSWCGASDAEFAAAIGKHKEGRWADAYGRLVDLANRGDPDAARVALFMLRYGPVLYGSHWDASTEEVEYWQNLTATGWGRSAPVFKPQHHADRSRKPGGGLVSGARLTAAPGKGHAGR